MTTRESTDNSVARDAAAPGCPNGPPPGTEEAWKGPEITLRRFSGPLDLLLHLVREKKISVTEIKISEITDQYLECVALMEELKMEEAGDFIVLAATLMYLKSLEIVPSPEEDEEEADEAMTREELIRLLREHEAMKTAADELERKFDSRSGIFFRPSPADVAPNEEMVGCDLSLLLLAFRKVLKSRTSEIIERVTREEFKVEDRIEEVAAAVAESGEVSFESLFPEDSTRGFIIATFLAILELIRLGRIMAVQGDTFGEIWIRRTSGEAVNVGG